MDIRFINSKNEIINASRLSIKVMKASLIGIDERGNVVLIESYGNKEEAKEVLKGVGEIIYNRKVGADILIDLRKEEENGESEECKEEYKNTEGNE